MSSFYTIKTVLQEPGLEDKCKGPRNGISACISPTAKDSELFISRSNYVPSSLFDQKVRLFKPFPELWTRLKQPPGPLLSSPFNYLLKWYKANPLQANAKFFLVLYPILFFTQKNPFHFLQAIEILCFFTQKNFNRKRSQKTFQVPHELFSTY